MSPKEDRLKQLAVLLNENARKVGKRVKKKFADTYPKVNLYTSKTLEEARAKVREIVHGGHEKIICGGGDGTLVAFLSHLKEEIDEYKRSHGEDKNPPEIGILSLGTGNGWAYSIGASNWKKTLEKIHSENYTLTPFSLIESEGFLFHFAGFGWDAAVLNNYIEERVKHEGTKWEKWFKSIFGYLYAVFVKTVPREILRYRPIWCKIVNHGDEVYLGSLKRGIVPISVKPGQTLYEGPVNAVLLGTTEFYGFSLKVLPYARSKSGFLHLRIGHVKPMSVILRTSSIWKGRVEMDGIYDYLAKDIEFHFKKPMPFQIGGDAMGYRTHLRAKVSDLIVNIMDFSEPPPEDAIKQLPLVNNLM